MSSPTTPDLVLLSLLSEKPMHGYQVNAELERRCIRDWAAISRPQVYYSLEKLSRLGLLKAAVSKDESGGPERAVYATSARGRTAITRALADAHWTQERERPPFLTWLALSWLLSPAVFDAQVARRREYLQEEIARERRTLRDVRKEVKRPDHEAIWMIELTLAQFRTELLWLRRLKYISR